MLLEKIGKHKFTRRILLPFLSSLIISPIFPTTITAKEPIEQKDEQSRKNQQLLIQINRKYYPINERNHLIDPSSGEIVTDTNILEKIIETKKTYHEILKYYGASIQIGQGKYKVSISAQKPNDFVVYTQDKIIEYAQNLRWGMKLLGKVTISLLTGTTLSYENITKEGIELAIEEMNKDPKKNFQQMASHQFHKLRRINDDNSRIARQAIETQSLTYENATTFLENQRTLDAFLDPTLDFFKEATEYEINQGEWTEEFYLPIKIRLESNESTEKIWDELVKRFQSRVKLHGPFDNFQNRVSKNISHQEELKRNWNQRIRYLAEKLAEKQIYESSMEYPIHIMFKAMCNQSMSDEEVYIIFPPKLIEIITKEKNITTKEALQMIKEYTYKDATRNNRDPSVCRGKVLHFELEGKEKYNDEVAIAYHIDPFFPFGKAKYIIHDFIKIGNYWYPISSSITFDEIEDVEESYKKYSPIRLFEKRNKIINLIQKHGN